MRIHTNYNLIDQNAYRVSVSAREFIMLTDTDQICELHNLKDLGSEEYCILGSGANTLFVGDFTGLVLKVAIRGIDLLDDDSQNIRLQVGAGEDWCELVEYTVNKGYSGIENLALIPGTVGAAPIQNIAAYGQNLVDVLESVDAVELSTGQPRTFSNHECQLGYRDSIFKRELKDQYLITSITLRLLHQLKAETSYHSRYESLQKELDEFAKPPYSISDIFCAVKQLRKQKLPSIDDYGTAGSVFKNPVVSQKEYHELRESIPNLQCYPLNQLSYPQSNDPMFKQEDHVKIPAGWLLDELGWKGRRIGDCGTWQKHALIVVNYGNATGIEIWDFIRRMQEDVYQNYGIELEPEINIIGREE